MSETTEQNLGAEIAAAMRKDNAITPSPVQGELMSRAQFLDGIEIPSPRRVLIWFAEDPATFLSIGKMMMDLKSQETFSGAWQLCMRPAGDKLAPRLDKLFSLDEDSRGRVGLFSEISDDKLIEHICKNAAHATGGRGLVGVQGVSGFQVNPDQVRRVAMFFGEILLPLIMQYMNRRKG